MIVSCSRFPRLFALLLLALSCALSVQSRTIASAYDQIRSTVDDLSATDCAKLLTFSVTKHGRPILGVAITDPSTPIQDKTRIIIVAGQHGNEPNSASAVAELAVRWSTDDSFADLRQNAIALIIPAANPDGLASATRYDASGADPNRDWDSLSLPETSAIARIIDHWKPHLILDEHEWSLTDGYRFDCVELSGAAPDQSLVSLGKHIRASAMPPEFSPVDSLPWRDPSLFHRHFLSQGYLTYLIETSPDDSLATKQRLYIQLSAALARQAVAKRDAIEQCSASSDHYNLPAQILAWRPPQSAPSAAAKPLPAVAALALAAVYCLLLFCGQSRRASRDTVPDAKRMAPRGTYVPATPHGMLPEITYRSQASRRSGRGR